MTAGNWRENDRDRTTTWRIFGLGFFASCTAVQSLLGSIDGYNGSIWRHIGIIPLGQALYTPLHCSFCA
jgi:hypothetical protein